MRRVRGRLFVTILCTLAISFLILLLYSDIIYLKVLSLSLMPESNDVYKIFKEIGLTIADVAYGEDIQMISTDRKISINANILHQSLTVPDITSKDVKKLITDLYQFSLYNPSYKNYMEFPQPILLPPANPNLAEVWNFTVTILEFRRVPPVVGRKVNISAELLPLIKDLDLIDTFYVSSDGRHCFYGKCRMYCDRLHSFCGNPDMIEGSFAAYLPPAPYELLSQRLVKNPWKRTYIPHVKAEWEKNPNYCNDVVKRLEFFQSTRRLYDVIDCAIFDFLIGNEDRHDYDVFNVFGNDNTPTFIHLDNGRGFGRTYHDEESIIAPLTQCCQVRLSTFNKLYSFLFGPRSLSDLMRESLYRDPVSPVLTELHLQALDRRVSILLQVVHRCIKNYSSFKVFLNDIKL